MVVENVEHLLPLISPQQEFVSRLCGYRGERPVYSTRSLPEEKLSKHRRDESFGNRLRRKVVEVQDQSRLKKRDDRVELAEKRQVVNEYPPVSNWNVTVCVSVVCHMRKDGNRAQT